MCWRAADEWCAISLLVRCHAIGSIPRYWCAGLMRHGNGRTLVRWKTDVGKRTYGEKVELEYGEVVDHRRSKEVLHDSSV